MMNVIKTLGTAQLVKAQETEYGKALFLEFNDLADTTEFVGYQKQNGELDLNQRPYMGASDRWDKAQRILKLMGVK